jgi:glycosyltransferase A (GT-A) superfamily protein (DUF2064 family)
MTAPGPSRCVLLFARPPAAEARAKGLAGAEGLFDAARERVRRAVEALPGVDLVQPNQRGATFGERVRNAFEDAGRLGYVDVVAVPGDVLGLSTERLREAFAALGRAETVLGPSPDGGVYLIGCRASAASLLDGVRWRTAHVFDDLRERAPGCVVLPGLADLDGARDLIRLERDPTLPRELRALVRRVRLALRPSCPGSVGETPGSVHSTPDAPRGPPPAVSLP